MHTVLYTMDNQTRKQLSSEERQKLKERLALLKEEYNLTVKRLKAQSLKYERSDTSDIAVDKVGSSSCIILKDTPDLTPPNTCKDSLSTSYKDQTNGEIVISQCYSKTLCPGANDEKKLLLPTDSPTTEIGIQYSADSKLKRISRDRLKKKKSRQRWSEGNASQDMKQLLSIQDKTCSPCILNSSIQSDFDDSGHQNHTDKSSLSVVKSCQQSDISEAGVQYNSFAIRNISLEGESVSEQNKAVAILKKKDQLNLFSLPMISQSSTDSEEKILSSSTIIEGLIFPVEYYVRTTRRMASCQRKVNLEAVIENQLGKSHKKSRKTSLVCQKTSTISGRSSPEAHPLCSGCPTSRSQDHGQYNNLNIVTNAVCASQSSGLQSKNSREVNVSFLENDPNIPDSTHGEASHSSICPLLPKNPQLFSEFTVKDFHLPDEDFGWLKLQKLKSSPARIPGQSSPRYFTRSIASKVCVNLNQTDDQNCTTDYGSNTSIFAGTLGCTTAAGSKCGRDENIGNEISVSSQRNEHIESEAVKDNCTEMEAANIVDNCSRLESTVSTCIFENNCKMLRAAEENKQLSRQTSDVEGSGPSERVTMGAAMARYNEMGIKGTGGCEQKEVESAGSPCSHHSERNLVSKEMDKNKKRLIRKGTEDTVTACSGNEPRTTDREGNSVKVSTSAVVTDYNEVDIIKGVCNRNEKQTKPTTECGEKNAHPAENAGPEGRQLVVTVADDQAKIEKIITIDTDERKVGATLATQCHEREMVTIKGFCHSRKETEISAGLGDNCREITDSALLGDLCGVLSQETQTDDHDKNETKGVEKALQNGIQTAQAREVQNLTDLNIEVAGEIYHNGTEHTVMGDSLDEAVAVNCSFMSASESNLLMPEQLKSEYSNDSTEEMDESVVENISEPNSQGSLAQKILGNKIPSDLLCLTPELTLQSDKQLSGTEPILPSLGFTPTTSTEFHSPSHSAPVSTGKASSCQKLRQLDSVATDLNVVCESLNKSDVEDCHGNNNSGGVLKGVYSSCLEQDIAHTEMRQNKNSLKLLSKLKAPSGPHLVDVCTVQWYDINGILTPHVVTSGEWAVSLWGPCSQKQWSLKHTWAFTQLPIIKLITIPDAHSMFCVAFGKLQIREVRILTSLNDCDHFEVLPLCEGDISAILGVSNKRMVSCSGSGRKQTVELMCLSEEGRIEGLVSLASSPEKIIAFSEVLGQKDAVIGFTGTNAVVIWNLKTGHLLQRIFLGESCPATVCLHSYCHSGILYVLLLCRNAESQSMGRNGPFHLVAINPMNGKSFMVQELKCPPEFEGRFMDGDVKGLFVAATFCTGALVVWDLAFPCCRDVLHAEGLESWQVVRWSDNDSCLLAGQLHGDVYIYSWMGMDTEVK
ncbi:partner and localizer of BRCA2 isoform X2 [Polypterus senegalus]|uniref:partner and localizer of BRCA2 isoform X2 n=1 Tax=Polypterus senegalus TaxID=55291 RepID=UPI001962BEA2|nr:partner and localizer of BRCA2 isoform X2 [Polypterus senegalus]